MSKCHIIGKSIDPNWTAQYSSLILACICNTADAHKKSIRRSPKLQYYLVLSIQAADKHHLQSMSVMYIVFIKYLSDMIRIRRQENANRHLPD